MRRLASPSLIPLLIRAMRPKQWAKNGLLFAGLFFSRQMLVPASIGRALIGFGLFCLASGAVYLLNDILDAPRDRINPRKANRPIASGALSIQTAYAACLISAAAALAGSFWLSAPFGLCTSSYLLLMFGYCVSLKNAFLIDTMIIAVGFVIRAVAGVIVLRTPERAVPLTVWFVVCVTFLSLFIALCKRRSELTKLSADAVMFRPVLASYSLGLLDQMIALCTAGAVLSYTLYATSLPDPWMMLTTLPFVLFGVFRYLYLVYAESDGEAPEEVLAHDPQLLGCVILWLVALAFVYLPRQ